MSNCISEYFITFIYIFLIAMCQTFSCIWSQSALEQGSLLIFKSAFPFVKKFSFSKHDDFFTSGIFNFFFDNRNEKLRIHLTFLGFDLWFPTPGKTYNVTHTFISLYHTNTHKNMFWYDTFDMIMSQQQRKSEPRLPKELLNSDDRLALVRSLSTIQHLAFLPRTKAQLWLGI